MLAPLPPAQSSTTPPEAVAAACPGWGRHERWARTQGVREGEKLESTPPSRCGQGLLRSALGPPRVIADYDG